MAQMTPASTFVGLLTVAAFNVIFYGRMPRAVLLALDALMFGLIQLAGAYK
jgi:hypothetical protein